MRYTAIINDKAYTVEIGANNTVLIDGEVHTADFRDIDGMALYSLLLDNLSWEVLVERTGDQYRVLIDGELHELTYLLRSDARVDPVFLSDSDGVRIYRRSLSFLLVAAAVYFFIVAPLNALAARLKKEPPPAPPATRPCPECLSEIPIGARRCSHCTAVVG